MRAFMLLCLTGAVLIGAFESESVSAVSPPVLQSAALRRVHGSAGPFDLALSLDQSAPTTDPRQGPTATVVFIFDKQIIGAIAAVTEGTATVALLVLNGNDVEVTLTDIADVQYVAIDLTGVASADGGTGGTGTVRIGFLVGDVTQNRVITVSDLGQVNAQIAQVVTSANFLKDVNASGTLSVADKGITNSKVTKALPPPVCPPVTGAGTLHGSLVPDDTWTAAGNPHIVTFDVQLHSGTLTLEPCVVVRVQNGFNIAIGEGTGGSSAKLIALGTPHLPIVIESQVATEFWGTLRVLPTGQADLESVTLRRAGNPATAQAFGGALQVLGDGPGTPLTRHLHVKNVRIETSATFGLNVQSWGGVTEDSSGLVITDSGKAPGNIAIDTSYPIYVATPSINTLPRGTYTGNAKDEILVDNTASFSVDETFNNLGVPYRIRFGYAQGPTLSAAQGGLSTLTIQAGVTIKLLKDVGNDWAISLGSSNGDLPANIFPLRLIANGTPEEPIVFTSDSPTPAPGDWGGIRWNGGPASGNVVNNVRVEYAGGNTGASSFSCGPADNDAALLILNWVPADNFVQNSTFSNSLAGGIVMGWTSDTVLDFKTGNTFGGIGNGCDVARWKNKTLPACPAPPPVCF